MHVKHMQYKNSTIKDAKWKEIENGLPSLMVIL